MPIFDDTARRLLDHLNGRATLPITGPLRLYITGPYGPPGTNGSLHTEGPQTITLALAVRESEYANGVTTYYWVSRNETAVVFPNLSEMTVTGWYITDSSATPIKVWEGETIRDRIVPAGDSYEVPAGALVVRLED